MVAELGNLKEKQKERMLESLMVHQWVGYLGLHLAKTLGNESVELLVSMTVALMV
jgi:hypothetical protein